VKKSLSIIGSVLAIAGAQAAQAAVTTYNVTQTYHQVHSSLVAKGNNTIFTGSFSFDDVSQTVSNLTGSLTQSMTGDTLGVVTGTVTPMTTLPLQYQLSSVYDATLGGLLVTSFYQNTTDVFAGGGFASTGTMGAVYTYGNQNAYATLFVNTTDPTAALTQAQINKVAYGDCTDGGLMGMGAAKTICMAGWVKLTNDVPSPGGTMMGTYPITQSITAAVPEPETYALMLAGLGMVGLMTRGRKTV